MDVNELARLRDDAQAVIDTKNHVAGSYHTTTALKFASDILALLDEVERLREPRGENPLGEMLRVQEIERQRDRARAEVERLHSWAGLIELLDEHWPEDIFPTLPDDKGRALGPRLVSLIRMNDQLRARLAEAKAVHGAYFDMDGEPGFDETEPEPEDVWRYDRDFRAALAEGGGQ